MVDDFTAKALTDSQLKSCESVANLVNTVASEGVELRKMPSETRTLDNWTKRVKSAVAETDGGNFSFRVIDDENQLDELETRPNFRVCSDLAGLGKQTYKPWKLQVEPYMDGQWPTWRFCTTSEHGSTLSDKDLGDMWTVRRLAHRINDRARKFEKIAPNARTLDEWTETVHKEVASSPTIREVSLGVIPTLKRVETEAACKAALDYAEGRGESVDTLTGFRKCDSSKWTSPNQRRLR
jgi:hypothetical protein